MEITIYKKDATTSKTSNDYIGEIVSFLFNILFWTFLRTLQNDIFNLLPADCSNGVRILTTTRKNDGGMIWFVKKIINEDVIVQPVRNVCDFKNIHSKNLDITVF